MGRYCSASGCKEKVVEDSNLSFHLLPKDEDIRKVYEWAGKIKRKSLKPTEYIYLCSKHFAPECFDTNKLGGTRLKKGAIPTIIEFANNSPEKTHQSQMKPKLEAEKNADTHEDLPTGSGLNIRITDVRTILEFTNDSPETSHKPQTKTTEENVYNHEDAASEHNADQLPAKNFLYVGKFNENDMDSPAKARRYFKISSKSLTTKNTELRTLRGCNAWLKERVASLNRELQNMKKENLVTKIVPKMKDNFKENLSKNIADILKITTEEAETVCNFVIDEHGVAEFQDLGLLKEDDLAPVLKTINRRKLILSWTSQNNNPETNQARPVDASVQTEIALQSIPESNQVMSVDASVQAEIALQSIPESNQVMSVDASVQTEIALQSIPESNQGMPVDAPVQTEIASQSIPESNQVMPLDAPIQTETTSQSIPDSNQGMPLDASIQTEIASQSIPESNRVIPLDAPIQTEIASQSIPESNQVMPLDAPIKTEIASQSIPPFKQNNWLSSFSVPWEKMPASLMKSLDDGKSPHPSDRRKMVKIVVDEIRKYTHLPGIKAINSISKCIVDKYPSMRDSLFGDVIFEGNTYLSKQIRNRIENLNRGKGSNTKRVADTPLRSSTQKKPAKMCDKYGCCNWEPLITEADMLVQEEKRQELFLLHQNGPRKSISDENIKKYIISTFPLQRREINIPVFNIQNFYSRWPCVFFKAGLLQHFCELAGINLEERLDEEMNKKGKKVISFLQTLPSGCNRKEMLSTKQKLEDILASNDTTEEDYDLEILLFLITSYFGEPFESLFRECEVTSNQNNVSDIVDLPSTPCVLYCGGSIFDSPTFMLFIDGIMVNNDIKDFKAAFMMLVASYFIFNIKYPKILAATMEFVQRCLMNINPIRGTRQKKNIKDGILPRVLSLLNNMSSFK